MSPVASHKRLDGVALTERSMWWRAGLSVAGVLLVGAAITGLLGYLNDPRNLPIQTIRVSGALKHIERESVEAVVAAAIDGNFFTLDMTRIRDRVRELPWVDQVSVRRLWPDTLLMQVLEQVPIARWGRNQLINARGEIFAPKRTAIAAPLARLDGPQGSVSRVIAFLDVAKAELQGIGLTIRRLQMNERREWSIETADGMILVLGQQQPRMRLRRFVSAYPVLTAQAERHPMRVDLRYAQGFAVAWADGAGAVDRRPLQSNSNPAGKA